MCTYCNITGPQWTEVLKFPADAQSSLSLGKV